MWGNISGVVGAALEKVQKISSELESQMDEAVGANPDDARKEKEKQKQQKQGAQSEMKPADSNSSMVPTEPVAVANTLESDAGDVDASDGSRLDCIDLEDASPTTTPTTITAPKSKSKRGNQSVGVTRLKKVSSDDIIIDNQTTASPTADVLVDSVSISSVETNTREAVSANAEVVALRAEHDRIKSKLRSAHEQMHQKEEELRGMLTAMEHKHASTHKAALDRHTSELSTLQQELVSKQQEASLQRERDMAAAIDKAVKEAVAVKDKEIREAATEFRNAKYELEQQLSDKDRLHAEALSTHSTQNESRISALQIELSVLQQQLQQHRDAAAAAVVAPDVSTDGALEALSAAATATAAAEEQKQMCLTLNATVDNLNGTIQSRDSQIKSLKSALDEKEDEIRALQRNVVNVKEALSERERALETANEQLAQSQLADSSIGEEQKKIVAQLQQSLQAAEKQCTQQSEALRTLVDQNDSLAEQLQAVNRTISEKNAAISALEKADVEHQRQLKDATKKITDLNAEIAAKDLQCRQLQTSMSGEGELTKQMLYLQEKLKESNDKLAAYEREGQNLAKKQSEMEKIVRKTKVELREKDAEIVKLKESKEQLVKAIEQTQDVLKKHESDSANAAKNMNAMQAVSQAATDKLTKYESELHARGEELSSQRRALETAWAEATDLKRAVAELKAERDDLRRRIGEGTSKVMETESSRRDIEQREAVLRATSKQLQDTLQRQMQESTAREERLREEVNDMRKKWQEAIGSREAMASELGNATAPLLRQISSLQESIRLKSEHWQNIEGNLSERALRAENAAETAEHKRNMMEEQLATLKQQNSIATGKLEQLQSQQQSAESALERLKRREATWLEEKTEVESRLSLETAQRQSLQSSLRELEMRQKMELQDLVESNKLAVSKKEQEVATLQKELDAIREEMHYMVNSSGGNSGTSKVSKRRPSPVKFSSSDLVGGIAAESSTPSSVSIHEEYFVDVDIDPTAGRMPGSLPNGEVSFAAAEKLHQRSMKRDEDLRSLNAQILSLQASRNALLEEVSYLSERNSQLEEEAASVPQLTEDLQSTKKRAELLLVLLGEKDEELEAALQDMQEVKTMYRSHMEELIEGKVGSVIAITDTSSDNNENKGQAVGGSFNGSDEDSFVEDFPLPAHASRSQTQ